MAPKGKKGGGGTAMEEESQDMLQALVLTDSYETRFAPFTLERPRCLLPLANTPLIEYTLEFLANAGVEEVFVYCGAHRTQVEEYLQRSKWLGKSSPFSNLRVLRSTAESVGDAMRDLDKLGLLKNDFFIVYGDVVSNLSLEVALTEHKNRRTTDKNAIMTMVLRQAGGAETEQENRKLGGPIFAIDPRRDRCLHYETMNSNQTGRFVQIDPDVLSCPEVDIRADLIDCGIDICTPDVLALWSDNFDFRTPRHNFLYSVLKDYELNGKTIHTHIVREDYAARVESPMAYDAVSKDIISRYTFPLTPDTNLVPGQTYELESGYTYKERNIYLARSSKIGAKTVLAAECSVGEGTSISNSVIGKRCIIGRNVVVDGAYIWDDAVIGDGSVVTRAVVANEAVVGKNCAIEAGALISYSVKISDGTTVKGSSRITRMKRERAIDGEEEEELTRAHPDPRVVGVNGDGVEYVDSDEEDDDDQDYFGSVAPHGLVFNLSALSLSLESISTLNTNSTVDSEESHPNKPTHRRTHSAASFLSETSEDSHGDEYNPDVGEKHHFHQEAASSLYDSLQRGDDSANMQLELNALRLSTNASEHAVRRAVAAAFGRYIVSLADPEGSHDMTVKAAVDSTISRHVNLLSRIVFDSNVPKKDDQVDLLLLFQADLAKRRDGDSVLLHLANELVRLDVIEAEGIEQWWANAKSGEEGDMARVRAKTKQLVDFLLEDDESDEEDESGEEGEESEED